MLNGERKEFIDKYINILFKNSIGIDNSFNDSDYIMGMSGKQYCRYHMNNAISEIKPSLFVIEKHFPESKNCKAFILEYINSLKDIYNFIQGEIVHYDKNCRQVKITNDMKFLNDNYEKFYQYLNEL